MPHTYATCATCSHQRLDVFPFGIQLDAVVVDRDVVTRTDGDHGCARKGPKTRRARGRGPEGAAAREKPAVTVPKAQTAARACNATRGEHNVPRGRAYTHALCLSRLIDKAQCLQPPTNLHLQTRGTQRQVRTYTRTCILHTSTLRLTIHTY